ncbi:unnamed protein product [Cylindrotheca closterium]|uniref:FAD/NAD(P)-binding domain-containing protein n=1 Tax=Cylindrotheca closterium TaxID=2856 RepID=A0AAD2CUT1_9STRA|nr:unnamed protein product [Cylindrotheca closterium]
MDTKNATTPKPYENKNTTIKVAIIGAGFAGLTLANYLNHYHHEGQQNSDSQSSSKSKNEIQYECLVLESKEQPISIVGTFRLPLHISTDVLEPIQRMRPRAAAAAATSNNNDNKNQDFTSLPNMTQESVDEDSSLGVKKWLISRPELLKWLRINVPIRYSARVEAVRRGAVSVASSDKNCSSSKGGDDDRHSYYVSIRSGSTGELSEVGPFDMVVVASGFSLSPRNGSNDDWKLDCTAIVGDVRCSKHAWWDVLGLTRIQKGGAMAMMDAMELAKRIVVGYDKGTPVLPVLPDDNDKRGESISISSMWLEQYSPQWRQLEQRKQKQRRRLLQFVAILLLLLLLLVRSDLLDPKEQEASEL